ncbi:MAG: hypothetical protein ACKVJA_06170, partial [Flavobacteriales bacterium]
ASCALYVTKTTLDEINVSILIMQCILVFEHIYLLFNVRLKVKEKVNDLGHVRAKDRSIV